MVPGISFIHSNKYFPIRFITNLFILTIHHRFKKKLAMARISGNMLNLWNACIVNYNSIDWPNCFGGWSIPLNWIWVGLIIYFLSVVKFNMRCAVNFFVTQNVTKYEKDRLGIFSFIFFSNSETRLHCYS